MTSKGCRHESHNMKRTEELPLSNSQIQTGTKNDWHGSDKRDVNVNANHAQYFKVHLAMSGKGQSLPCRSTLKGFHQRCCLAGMKLKVWSAQQWVLLSKTCDKGRMVISAHCSLTGHQQVLHKLNSHTVHREGQFLTRDQFIAGKSYWHAHKDFST